MRTVALTRTEAVRARIPEMAETAGLELVACENSMATFVESASFNRPQCLLVEMKSALDVGHLFTNAASGRPVAMVIIAEDTTNVTPDRSANCLILSRRLVVRDDRQAQIHVRDRISNFLERFGAVSRWTRSSRELSQELDALDLEGLDLE